MIYGVNVHQSGPEGLRLAASLGAEFIRIDGNWYDLEPTRGHFTWEWLDDLIATATSLGLQAYVTIGYSPSWIGTRNTPPPVAEWKLFIRAFGERYAGKIQFLGIWNEPNILYAGSVERYVNDLFNPASEVLESIDHNYRACGPDLSTQGQWRPWLHTFLREARGTVDILTVHAYGSPGRKVRDRLLEVRQVMDGADAMDLNVALTEFGWNTARISEAQQANYLDQLLESVRDIPWLIAVLYFNLINESTDVQWGLFRDNGTEKPAAEVFRRYANRGTV